MAAPERLLRPFLALIWIFQTTKSLPEVIKIGKYHTSQQVLDIKLL